MIIRNFCIFILLLSWAQVKISPGCEKMLHIVTAVKLMFTLLLMTVYASFVKVFRQAGRFNNK